MRITTTELAEICGVSIGTIDRALHNRPGIKSETKEKILKMAKELGYRPHLLARGLKQGKTMTFGVVVFDLANQFFAHLVEEIEERAKDAGYFVYLTITEGNIEEELDYLDSLSSLNVDGIILDPINGGAKFSQYLKSLKTPIVTIGNRVSKAFPFIGVKDRQAIKDAVAFIATKGYQRIVYVSPPLSYKGTENIYSVEERLAGYKEGLKETEMPHKPIVIGEKAYIEKLDTLKLREERTAILCSSDIYALEVLNYLRAKNIAVPDDVGLMGFDDIQVLKYVTPPLSTIAYPIEELGRKSVACLLSQINNEPVAPIELLDHRLIEGASL
ncbi:transcriptional regulator [Candidatus Moduliflexus flocculans]|uniref:Transcriptional regulator n=1 Tax=Candidatus Moduliflexus flocculans TaxID=1499966 RepID=A0A081BT86_9BACT|nr:transcriptional regulator [Candidatus Moduliflexus flocculans]